MRVVLINTYQTGGAAKACLRLHERLLSLGVESDMIVLYKTMEMERVHDFRSALDPFSNLANKGRNKGKRMRNSWRMMTHAKHEKFSFPDNIWNLARHPLVRQADVVNLHWVEDFLNYRTFFKKVKRPVVWTLHDFAPFSAGFHYPQDKAPGTFEEQNKELKQAVLANADITVVSPSQYLLSRSQTSELFGRFEHHHIPNIFPKDVFKLRDKASARAALGIVTDKPVLLFVTDNIKYKRKGYERLIPLIEEVKEKYFFVAVGGKSKEADLNFDVIHDEEKLALIYSAGDLLLCPSANENMPNIVVESLLCGTPVVAYNVGGLPEIVKSGDGLLIDPAMDLAGSQITLSLSNADPPEVISKRAHDRYSLDFNAQRYIEIYRKAMETA